MTAATYPIADQSASVVRHNMVRIKLLTVAGPLLCHTAQRNRVVRLLENRRAWGIEPPLVMLAVHSNDEMAAAKQFQSDVAGDLAQYVIVRQKGHNETVRGSGSCGPESSLCEACLRPETHPVHLRVPAKEPSGLSMMMQSAFGVKLNESYGSDTRPNDLLLTGL